MTNPIPVLYIDKREKRMVQFRKEIERAGYMVIEETLDIGDYVIDNGVTQFYIETKFNADFPGSLMNGKIDRDINDLATKDWPMFCIVGDQYDDKLLKYQPQNYANAAPRSVTGALVSVAFKPLPNGVRVPVSYLPDERAFIDALLYLMKLIQNPGKFYKRKVNSREQRIITHAATSKIIAPNESEAIDIGMICNLPNVGQQQAKNLLEYFDQDLPKALGAKYDDLIQVDKIGPKTAQAIVDRGFQEPFTESELLMIEDMANDKEQMDDVKNLIKKTERNLEKLS